MWMKVIAFVIALTWVAAAYGVNAPPAPGTLPCIQQLLPCQPYLKDPSNPPTPCCMPLKRIIATELPCLCALFNNQAIMKSFNITQANALALANSCGVHSAYALCQKAGVPGASPSTPSSSSNSSAVAPPPHANAAAPMCMSLAAVTGLVLTTFVS